MASVYEGTLIKFSNTAYCGVQFSECCNVVLPTGESYVYLGNEKTPIGTVEFYEETGDGVICNFIINDMWADLLGCKDFFYIRPNLKILAALLTSDGNYIRKIKIESISIVPAKQKLSENIYAIRQYNVPLYTRENYIF